MQRHTEIWSLEDSAKGAAVAMGNFDGVHLGHQSVLALARAAAADLEAPLGVVTFEPHPRSFFQPDSPAFRLMSAEARAHRFDKLEVAQLYEVPFDKELASMSDINFVRNVLRNALGVRHVVVGADFRFGNGRTGDVELLQKLGQTHGFGVTIAPQINDAQGDYSSTAIRTALREGRPEDAARVLGHWHRIEAKVIHGEKRGRDLGFPTINLPLTGLHLPKFGVYAVMVDVLTGPHQGIYQGAASIGERPTFGVNAPNLEVYLLDFKGDLYEAEVSVALVHYLRPEEKFDTLEALVEQMHEDCAQCREILDNLL
ncbi:MAG: bifunctional riboflavin kinase/FAD synthetase [Rhodobacteraceae bacterium]|nr:bifunctional riboflavin kinase/FAD synthetase [Paracoccaceae bacterium]